MQLRYKRDTYNCGAATVPRVQPPYAPSVPLLPACPMSYQEGAGSYAATLKGPSARPTMQQFLKAQSESARLAEEVPACKWPHQGPVSCDRG